MAISDENLFRAVEGAYESIPKPVRQSYDRDEIVNATWLILKSRGIKSPSRLQIKSASIDFHRMQTHYRRGQKHGDQFSNISFVENPTGRRRGNSDDERTTYSVPTPTQKSNSEMRLEVCESLKQVRQRYGNDGLMIFVLTRVMELDVQSVNKILDLEPESLLARSISGFPQEWTNGK